MNNWKIEVFYKPEVPDTIGNSIVEDISDLGISGVVSVRTATVYWVEGNLNAQLINRIGSELLADPITQNFSYNGNSHLAQHWTIEVQFKPGVTDAVGESAVKGIRDIGITQVESVRTGQKYWLQGKLNEEIIQTIAQRLLMNDVIQTYSYEMPKE